MSASTIFLLVLLLACPLMMVFMHRGHGNKHSTHDANRDEDQDASTATPPSEEHLDDDETEADDTGRRRPRASSHH